MEIEKKFLVKQMPEHLEQYEKWELEQCYLCGSPVIRIRRKNEEYILTYKSRPPKEAGKDKLCIAEELEVPLTGEAYEHLKRKADGICIVKTRYRIPYGKYCIELDIFHGDYEGRSLAEVEFETVEEGMEFTKPDWFGEDVSGDFHYSNRYLALCGE